jgi:hypothetical protein
MSWRKSDAQPGLHVWTADARTATLIERRTAVGVDTSTGDVRLVYTSSDDEVHVITFPPAVSTNLGTVLIQAGTLAVWGAS